MQNILKNSGLVLVNSSNYNKWQYAQFQKHVGGQVLEIGCGLGNITQYLLRDSKFLLSVDIKKDAVDFIKTRIPTSKNFHVECLDVFTQGLRQHSKIRFDTIILSNVLEHIKDDLNALQMCNDILQKTVGRLLLLVPAHKFLYGTLDEETGHFRRYEKKDIITLAAKSNFEIIDLYAFNFIGALGWYLNYCLFKKKNTNNCESSMQIGLYDRWMVKPCKFIESIFRPKIGISYIAILKAIK